MYIRPMTLDDALQVCHSMMPEQLAEYKECGEHIDADSDAVKVFNRTQLSFAAVGVAWTNAIWGFDRITPSTVNAWVRSQSTPWTNKRDWVLISQFLLQTAYHLYESDDRVHRIQSFVATDRIGAVNLAKRLGGRIEGTMHDYGGEGRDYYIMAFTRQDWKEKVNGRRRR